MNKITTFYIVRHGESDFNAQESTIEYKNEDMTDSPLSDLGVEQAEKLSDELKDVKFDAAFSSDLARTEQTAEILAKERQLAVETSDLIRERSIYAYLHKKGRLTNEGLKEFHEKLRKDLEGLDEKARMQYKAEGEMESREEGALRLLNFIREVAVAYPGKTILIASHGNIMRSLLTYLGWAKYEDLGAGAIVNTGYFVLETDGSDISIKEDHGIINNHLLTI